MIEIVAGVCILIGAGFCLIAGLGILNLPDALNRMHASTKAGTVGSILTLSGAAFVFDDGAVTARSVATILFLLLTAPIAAHMIGRATVQIQRLRQEGDRDEPATPPGKAG